MFIKINISLINSVLAAITNTISDKTFSYLGHFYVNVSSQLHLDTATNEDAMVHMQYLPYVQQFPNYSRADKNENLFLLMLQCASAQLNPSI